MLQQLGVKMSNTLHPQSTVSHLNKIKVDGWANCHAFWYKHIFYVLFVRPNSIHVSGGSTLSGRGWKFNLPTSTRPPPWYQCLILSCQSINHNDSLHQCHNNTSFRSILKQLPITRLWLISQYLHAPTVGSKNVKYPPSTINCITPQ